MRFTSRFATLASAVDGCGWWAVAITAAERDEREHGAERRTQPESKPPLMHWTSPAATCRSRTNADDTR